jgi:hypothetical protein
MLVILCLCWFVSGCIGGSVPTLTAGAAGSAAKVGTQTSVTVNTHAGWIEILAPAVNAGSFLENRHYQLRSWIDPGNAKMNDRFMLSIRGGFPKRVYLEQAYAHGQPLKTRLIDRERVDCGLDCFVQETVGLPLGLKDIERYAVEGLDVEIQGRRDVIRVKVPPSYFAAVLDVHTKTRSRALGSPSAL